MTKTLDRIRAAAEKMGELGVTSVAIDGCPNRHLERTGPETFVMYQVSPSTGAAWPIRPKQLRAKGPELETLLIAARARVPGPGVDNAN